MGRFGFDYDATAAMRGREPPSPNETLRTLSDLAGARQQQQAQAATLADMLHRQERARALEGIYSANADSPDALPPALLRGGFGPEAFGAQDQSSQMTTAQAQRAKWAQDAEAARAKLFQAAQAAASRERHERTTEAINARQFLEDGATGAIRHGNRLTGKVSEVVPGDPSRLQNRGRGGAGASDLATARWSGRVPKDTLSTLDGIRQMDTIADEFGGWDKVPGAGFGEGWLPGQTLAPRADEFRRIGLSIIAARRNHLFGASLTPGEKASFEKIADMGGKATTAQIRNAMTIIRKATEQGAHQALAGAPDEAKSAILGDLGISAPGGELTPAEAAELEARRKRAAK